jgi:hypothetical protein
MDTTTQNRIAKLHPSVRGEIIKPYSSVFLIFKLHNMTVKKKGNSIFHFEQKAGIDSKMGNWGGKKYFGENDGSGEGSDRNNHQLVGLERKNHCRFV